MKRVIKRVGLMIIAMTLTLAMGIEVLADSEIDLSRTGTLKIQFDSAVFTIYQVQEWKENGGDKVLEWISPYEEIGAELGDLLALQGQDSASKLNEAAKKLLAFIEEYEADGTEIEKKQSETTDSSGCAKFTNLKLGVYLVVWSNQSQDMTTVDPFLVFLPYKDEDGEWWYEITVSPKTSIIPIPTPEPSESPGPGTTPEPDETPNPEVLPTVRPRISPSPSPTLEPVQRLPQTGTLQWPVPVLAGGGVILFLAGFAGSRGKKSKAKKKDRNTTGRGPGAFLIVLGPVMIAGGLGLLIFNNWDNQRAEQASESMLTRMEEKAENKDTKETEDGNTVCVEIDGYECIGEVEIPVLDITLPVISELTYPGLKIAPCRYVGSIEDNSLIIAAHNYARHFGNIYLLSPGDEVIFSDVEGNVYDYRVTKIEVLDGTAVEEMEEGEWDMTLFTCTYGGKNRITVRCDLKSEI